MFGTLSGDIWDFRDTVGHLWDTCWTLCNTFGTLLGILLGHFQDTCGTRFAYVLITVWTLFENWWIRFKYYLEMFWTFLEMYLTLVEQLSVTCWSLFGHVSDTFQTFVGYFLTLLKHLLDMLCCISWWHILRTLFVLLIMLTISMFPLFQNIIATTCK
jgi:hypothetical protein